MKKVIFLVIIGFIICPINTFAKSNVVILSKCVDGDTAKFKIDGKIYSTRFLAIDTPETVKPNTKVQPYGKEASNYTCNELKNASKITLEYDSNSTKEDKYGRRLAWVFVDDDLLQEKLISVGYAKVAYLYGDYKYTNILKVKQLQAQSKKIGIWSDNSNTYNDESNDDLNKILVKLYRYIRKEIKSML